MGETERKKEITRGKVGKRERLKKKATGKTGSEREILRQNKFPIRLPYQKHLQNKNHGHT